MKKIIELVLIKRVKKYYVHAGSHIYLLLCGMIHELF